MMRIVIVIALEKDEGERSLISDIKVEWLIVGNGENIAVKFYKRVDLMLLLYGAKRKNIIG